MTVVIETHTCIKRDDKGRGFLVTIETHWFGTLSARYEVARVRAPEWDL